MTATFDITPAEREQIIKDARNELVQRLYDDLAEDIQTVSRARAAGLLDVDPKTLDAIGVPRLPFSDKLVKYRLSTVARFLDKIEEK